MHVLRKEWFCFVELADEETPRFKTVPLEEQTLESFYETASTHCPVRIDKYPAARLKSAPAHRSVRSASASIASQRSRSIAALVDEARKGSSHHMRAETPLLIHM